MRPAMCHVIILGEDRVYGPKHTHMHQLYTPNHVQQNANNKKFSFTKICTLNENINEKNINVYYDIEHLMRT